MRRFFLLWIPLVLGAETNYLSPIKQEKFELERQKNSAEADKLKWQWLSVPTLGYGQTKNYDYPKTQKTTGFSVSVNQPIFKSGGIYYGIKYADVTRRFGELDIASREKEMIKTAIALLYGLKKATFEVSKQELLVQNATIDVERKREQFLAGFIDSGTLDSALLDRNSAQMRLFALLEQKAETWRNLRDISDVNPDIIELPRFELVNEDAFRTRNNEIKKASLDREKKAIERSLVVTTFLPTLAISANYYNQEYANSILRSDGWNEYYTTGLTLSIPFFDVTMVSKLESARVDFLKASLQESDTRRSHENFYLRWVQGVEIIKRKIALSQDDIRLYDSLLQESKGRLGAGEITIFDVETIENSLAIRKLDSEIYAIDEQLALAEIYGKMHE